MTLIRSLLCGALCAILLLPGVPVLAAENDGGPVLTLADEDILLDGQPVPEDDPSAAVYTAHDIVYYEAGHDFTYGEGTEKDAHTAAEAAAHTVVHIAQPGTYVLQGALEKGQIAVDLGEDAASDPDAVVTLVLDGVDVTCAVAPAVIFYNVYECDPDGTAGAEPDLSGTGARVVIADGSQNDINGSYVARIYKSYTLNEDDLSVVTVNGGTLSITVTGQTGEGDGIDSNGALIVNGGTVTAQACSHSADAGLDAATGIYPNGGTVIATGSMLDPITASDQCCAAFSFPQAQAAGARYALTDGEGAELLAFTPENDFSILLMTCPALEQNTEYSLSVDGSTVSVTAGGMGMGGGFGGGMGDGGP